MSETRRLARQANITLTERDGLSLVPSAAAEAFLKAIHEAGVRILAIDGFVIEDGELYADAAAESDFTDLDDLDDVVEEAEDFLAGFGQSDDLYWDFILDEDD